MIEKKSPKALGKQSAQAAIEADLQEKFTAQESVEYYANALLNLINTHPEMKTPTKDQAYFFFLKIKQALAR